MNINKIFGIQVLLAVFLFFLGSGAQAQTGDPVGLILSTSGSVTAEAEDGTERRLRRRSPIYEGDTVITAARSRAQIRFNDNGLVALQPETSFLVEEHTFNGQEDGTESAVYRLFRGGLQAITGLIGNTNKDRYRFETPLATIGLRGTHWAATYCSTSCNGLAPGLYGGVAEGGIDVCNAGGCEDIDQDGYFYVQDQNTSPTTLVRKPSVVFEDTTSDRDEEEQEEEGDSEEGGGEEGDTTQGDDDQGENESGDAADAKVTVAQEAVGMTLMAMPHGLAAQVREARIQMADSQAEMKTWGRILVTWMKVIRLTVVTPRILQIPVAQAPVMMVTVKTTVLA